LLNALFIAGVGNLRSVKQNHPARRPFTNCSNCMDRLVVLYFMNLPSLQHLLFHTYEEILYEKPHSALHVLYVVFPFSLLTVKIRS